MLTGISAGVTLYECEETGAKFDTNTCAQITVRLLHAFVEIDECIDNLLADVCILCAPRRIMFTVAIARQATRCYTIRATRSDFIHG